MTNARSISLPAFNLLGRVSLCAAALLAATAARAQSIFATPYTFSTLAGTEGLYGGFADGTGPAASFDVPAGICVDSNGNVYVADQFNDTIRKITPGGVVSTLAGTPLAAGSADGTGASARFNGPAGVAVDSSGNLYVSDTGNDTIRKITPGGVVSTYAGAPGGIGGSNDGTGAAAQFSGPAGITVDGSGNVFVADQINDTIRKIAPGGVVTTFAGLAAGAGASDGAGSTGRFRAPYGVRADSSGNVYVADTGNQTIRKITPGGTVSTLAGTVGHSGSADGQGTAASFNIPLGVGVDGSGNVYVADYNNDTIRKITSGGAVTTIAGVVKTGGFVDGQGTGAQFYGPYDVVVDGSGNLIVSDEINNTIRKITSGGAVTTFAGIAQAGYADGTGDAARFNRPTGVAVDHSGNYYVADDYNYTIRKVTPSGVVTTVAGTPGDAGSANGTGSAALFNGPFRVVADSSNNLFVTDYTNNAIREITPGGVVSVFAGTVGVAGSTDGTGTGAKFNGPLGICVDSSGNFYVVEQQNNTVRKITPAGVVTTLAGTAGTVGSDDGTGAAAKFSLPAGDCVDSSGNVYVADYGNSTIRKITPGGVVTTVAGQVGSPGSKDATGTAAQFYSPAGVAVDSGGNLYVADSNNNTIRKISSSGVVTTLAGVATIPATTAGGKPTLGSGFTDGTGAAATFFAPFDLVLDGAGDLIVADSGNNEIRVGTLNAVPAISSQPATQYASVGGSATFSVTASGSSALSYQWTFNGAAISGATASSYTVSNAQTSNSGTYAVVVTDNNGSTTSAGASLTVSIPGTSTSRLTNISTRANVGTGSNILIPGFHIAGTGSETLLIRAVGPTLSVFGVGGILAQPVLTVIDSTGATVATNTGWGTSSNAAQLASLAQGLTFALTTGSADCAILATLPANASYTVQVSGLSSTTGVALAEIYEISYTGSARLSNISTRANVGTGGNILIPGFVISGTGTEKLLIRADGPVLSVFGVSGTLAAPSLEILSGSTVTASNIGWSTSANAAQIAASAVGVTFALPTGSADSAAIVNLAPGPYTVQVAGVNSTTGVALAEIYEVP
jgi:hypothetical protein